MVHQLNQQVVEFLPSLMLKVELHKETPKDAFLDTLLDSNLCSELVFNIILDHNNN